MSRLFWTALIAIAIPMLTRAQEKPLTAASWINPPVIDTGARRPCPIFEKEFKAGKQVAKATLYVSAFGLYEASLNGKRIGNDHFSPGFTDYNKRLQYQRYDVTKLVQENNRISVTVGEGWYRGVFRGAQTRDNYGVQAGLILQIYIVFKDGSSQTVNSDDTWKYAYGPIRYSELYDGELFDANITPNIWSPVKILDYPKNILELATAEPVRKQETFTLKRIFTTPKGEKVIDFGQNLAGWVQLNLTGQKGDTIKIQHAEVLDKDGNFYTGNLREAAATDIYVLNGKKAVYEPHFTYHGFRYIKYEGFDANVSNCKAIALYSDLKKTGTFSCSDTLINRLQKNIEWSLNSNFFSIPTDCPQRSERLGWGADAQVFAPTACFLRDTKNFYASWLKDLALEQRGDGSVPLVIPSVGNYKDVGGVAGWGDVATILPWTLYETYNDPALLRSQYASMKAWVDYIQNDSENGIWEANGFGDWYAPGKKTTLPFIDQCYWAHSTQLLINAAEVLHKTEDINKYKSSLISIKAAFAKQFINPDGSLTDTTQTAYVLALAFDMLPKEKRQQSAKRLVELIHQNGDHLATGFLGTPDLLKVLSDNGYADVAYILLNQKTYPSWLYPVSMGATTIWEKWDGMDPDGTVKPTSYNHYAYGAVGNWLYEYVAGIRMGTPGYKKIIIKPIPGGGLAWAKASYVSAFGKIISSWHVNGKSVTYDITIPKGTTASIELPGQPAKHVPAGHYVYKY